MQKPKVSIVTPTFNRAGYLPETIESILNQSFQDFEYIIIDDGSSDNTREVVARYDRLEYRYHDNMGEAASTNRGWIEAQGEYFAMVSSDDPMLESWLEDSIRFMDGHPDVLVGYPDWTMIDEDSSVIREIEVYEYSPEKLFGWVHCLPGPGAIIRKSALSPGYVIRCPRYKFVSDLESWFRLALLGEFARIPKVLATWRFHGGSTSIAEQSLERSKETLRLVGEFFETNDLPEAVRRLRRVAASRANYLAAVFVQRTFPIQALVYLLRAIALMPVQPADMPDEIRRVSWRKLIAMPWNR